jgi:phosphopentomutase
VAGYAAALEAFDERLVELLGRLKSEDLLIVTADHGCDPTWAGTDHTREQVPVLVLGGDTSRPIGARSSFADVGVSVAAHLKLPRMLTGRAF